MLIALSIPSALLGLCAVLERYADPRLMPDTVLYAAAGYLGLVFAVCTTDLLRRDR